MRSSAATFASGSRAVLGRDARASVPSEADSIRSASAGIETAAVERRGLAGTIVATIEDPARSVSTATLRPFSS